MDERTGAGVLWRAGCPLHYWTAGPAGAPWVALTHGVMMDHELFAPQLPALAAEFRVLRWDVRGHGRSRPMGDGFSIAEAARDLAALLDALEIDRAALVGHSMGGLIAQELAFVAPGRVSALAAISSLSLFAPLPAPVRLGLPLSVAGFRLCPDPLLRGLIGLGAGLELETRRYATRAAAALPKRDFDRIWPALAAGFHHEAGYRSPCPLLVVHGDRDDWVAFGFIKRLSRAWAARAPGCRAHVVRAAGHNANQDNPAELNAVLLDFLRQHGRG